MITTNKTVETSIYDIKDYLFERIDQAILGNEKIHITAPVGTHKTTLATEMIDLYTDYQLVFLFPHKSISTQLYHKLSIGGTPAYIFNSDTRKKLEEWEYQNQGYWPYTYLSTIDSAHVLLDEGKLNTDKTIFIIDETHSFLQNPRKDFDPTVFAIKDSGCPVIGFTATKSNWVMKYLLEIDEEIKIEATDIPTKRIVPIKVGRGMHQTVAELIEESKWGKVLIWIDNKVDQYKIKEEFKKVSPAKKVVVLNAHERDSLKNPA